MSDPSRTSNSQATRQAAQTRADRQEIAEKDQKAYPWLRYYEEGVPERLELPEHSLAWLLDSTSRSHPKHIAIIYYGTRISYAQLSSQANRFASELQRLGVQKGDRVAIALPNIPQFPIAFYGALRAGAVVVPTNPLYTEREMQHQLTDSGAKVIVMLDTFYPIVRKIRSLTAIEHVIVTSVADFMPAPLRLLYPIQQRKAKVPQPVLTQEELARDTTLQTMLPILQARSRGGIELFKLPKPASSKDLAVLQYTGGTTGLSKGAMLTHGNLLANAMQTRYWVPGIQPGKEISLCAAPFFHAYGLTVGMNISILAAATMVLMPRYKAKDALQMIRRYRPTLLPGIPTMYIGLLREVGKHPEHLQSIKACISGSAPLPAQVRKEFEQITQGNLVEGYGLSEAGPVTHCNPLTDQCRNGSIGLPLPNVEAAIVHQTTGEPLPAGEIGELVVKGPNIMQGYWNSLQETEEIFRNGWLRTGDLGKMDEDGYFYVVERLKEMIIASGFNIYPREVEEVLFTHPAIAEAAVTGITDAYRGETVAAFVVLKEGNEPTEQTRQDILAFCKQNLAGYKVPKQLEFRASLPKSTIGKVLRRELRNSKP